MNNFVHTRILSLVIGSTAAVLSSTSPAHALNFGFSFTGNVGSASGTVSGIIYGLTDNTANQAATDIQLTSLPASFSSSFIQPLPSSVFSKFGSPSTNNFTVTGGTITASNFAITANGNFWLNNNNLSVLDDLSNPLTLNNSGFAGITYSAATSTTVPFDIPGGATIPALGSLIALGGMRKARKIASKNISTSVTEKVI